MAAKKLLVADDSLTIQKVIRLALSGASSGADGYDIQAVSDGNDAIQQISLFRPDVVLIDVSLPGKSAFEVKRAINEHRDLDSVRFVLMSSAFEKVDEVQASEVQFHGRLTKPFDPAHLREVLIDVLAERTVFLNRGATTAAAATTPPPPISMEFEAADTIAAPPPLPPADFPDDFPPPLPPEAASSSDNDIKNLTESTIRMSGLDDFQWSVQEPSLKPSTGMIDIGNSNFPFSSGGASKASELEFIPPPPPLPTSPPDAIPISDFGSEYKEEPTIETHRERAAPVMSSDQMETMVRQEVEKALRKITQEMLPGVAERVIKQEIHRMLTEQS